MNYVQNRNLPSLACLVASYWFQVHFGQVYDPHMSCLVSLEVDLSTWLLSSCTCFCTMPAVWLYGAKKKRTNSFDDLQVAGRSVWILLSRMVCRLMVGSMPKLRVIPCSNWATARIWIKHARCCPIMAIVNCWWSWFPTHVTMVTMDACRRYIPGWCLWTDITGGQRSSEPGRPGLDGGISDINNSMHINIHMIEYPLWWHHSFCTEHSIVFHPHQALTEAAEAWLQMDWGLEMEMIHDGGGPSYHKFMW